jgi:hypothetical protein
MSGSRAPLGGVYGDSTRRAADDRIVSDRTATGLNAVVWRKRMAQKRKALEAQGPRQAVAGSRSVAAVTLRAPAP